MPIKPEIKKYCSKYKDKKKRNKCMYGIEAKIKKKKKTKLGQV